MLMKNTLGEAINLYSDSWRAARSRGFHGSAEEIPLQISLLIFFFF